MLLIGLSLPAQQLHFTKYSVNDGLVSNDIRNVYQDKTGFLWIGTMDGLSIYDGYRFTNFN
ncbi:MAG TPA: two-component regulator propeller domain-containing protein, partial [Phnomibacter sp.]|nr:two-component regulator propeller domain-containing protein [Phnomibacter sp.]